MGASDFERYLSYLVVEGKVSASTQKQALNALIFLYHKVLDIQIEDKIAPIRSKTDQVDAGVLAQYAETIPFNVWQIPDIITEETLVSVEFFEQQIQRLKGHALTLINSDKLLQRSLEIITSVEGIAESSAIQLLGEQLILPKDMNNLQWVAFAGLDPRHHQSGTSISKKPRISMARNNPLRVVTTA